MKIVKIIARLCTAEEWRYSFPTCSFKWQLTWFIQQNVTPCYFQEVISSYRIMSLRRSWRMYTWGEVITRCTLFPLTTVFFPLGFHGKVFNEATPTAFWKHFGIVDIKEKCYEYYVMSIWKVLDILDCQVYLFSKLYFVLKLL